jgi:diguanylate cyclase (GGDEF)-like protein
VQLALPSLADVKIVRPAQSNPWTLPVTELDEILDKYHVTNFSRRVRVHGTITYYQPGTALVLQSGPKSLSVMTAVEEPLRVGGEADVTGFPEVHDGFLVLAGGEVQQSSVYAPIAPRPGTWRQLSSSKSAFDLVSIEGKVVTEVREGSQDEYVLLSDGQMFSAIDHHTETGGAPPAPMRQIPPGSMVRVTGICVLENSNPFDREVPFDILMRVPGDMVVIAGPPLLNVRNLLLLAALLLVMVVAFGARSWALERKVRRQTAAAAALEIRRSRILEDINGVRPLAEVLEEITEMVSVELSGAPCWCEVADGARLGHFPPDAGNLRIVREAIPARSGPPLGAILAGLSSRGGPNSGEREVLSMGAELATLTIETRRLYSDLRHRSEFDLLTDIHNRFSLETQLDAQIGYARENAAVFGLVYIDLDNFKNVNDLHGHRIGDQYLQKVALRMKRQLRPSDLLARLGGDEFAVLVPLARNRSEVEEIARRLEHSLDEPFFIEEQTMQASASVGVALYPADGFTRDSLLSAADAAMYAAKNAKRKTPQSEGIPTPNSKNRR